MSLTFFIFFLFFIDAMEGKENLYSLNGRTGDWNII